MMPRLITLACLACGLAAGAGRAAIGERTPDFAAVLTRAGQVLDLPEAEAARAVPVQLRGVVVGEAPPIGKGFVLWDGQDSIYVRDETAGASGTFGRGDEVEIEGVSNAGGFTPSVIMTAGRRLGRGEPPAPRPVTADELLAGRYDAEWVRLRGIVRRCEPSTAWAGRWRLALVSGGQSFTVHVNAELAPAVLIDAAVAVDALVFNQHNLSRQAVSVLLFVPAGVPVGIEVPAPADPFAAPVRPVASLLQFERGVRFGHRVHVRGQVLHHEPGRALWIRDGERGLHVATSQADRLRPGDLVSVVGFPEQGAFTPRLVEASVRKIAAGAEPSGYRPENKRAAIVHDSDLVELEARLVESRRTGEGAGLVLDWQGALVSASLSMAGDAAIPAGWEPGATVLATGLCLVPADEAGRLSGTWEPQTFDLRLRSASDLRVLRQAPWWNRQRVFWALGGAAGLLLSALAVVAWRTRRRLGEQQRQRARAEAEFAAILAERNRIAREIHDTLAQGLSAISMRLELAKNAADATATSEHLALAHTLVRDTLAEARVSIWAMRSQALETRGLAGALESLLRQLAEGRAIETGFHVVGTPVPLAPMAENQLLRIGQEAIANAVRHAAPRRVDVRLVFAARQIELAVTDDGCGFDPAQVTASAGHFGLVGLRERAAQIGAQLELTSATGRGTQVRVVVPTAPE